MQQQCDTGMLCVMRGCLVTTHGILLEADREP